MRRSNTCCARPCARPGACRATPRPAKTGTSPDRPAARDGPGRGRPLSFADARPLPLPAQHPPDRTLARASRVLRRKRDGRYLAAVLGEGLMPLQPRLAREPGIDEALDLLDAPPRLSGALEPGGLPP